MQVKIPSIIEKIYWGPKSGPKNSKTVVGLAFVFGEEQEFKARELIKEHSAQWQSKSLEALVGVKELIHFSGKNGPVWIFCRNKRKGPSSHGGRLEDSAYSWCRDQIGSLLGYCKAYAVGELRLHLLSTTEDQQKGLLVGLDLSAYSYKNLFDGKEIETPKIIFDRKIDPQVISDAQALAAAVNLARHLVNAPPNFLNPSSMAQFIPNLLRGNSNLKVEVWNERRLKKEGMGLHLGVGQGASSPPCMIRVRYRPKISPRPKQRKPIAFVGKGVTFDTGGLDLKPSSNMRLMKKDMGGVATLAGLALWLSKSKIDIPVDIYLGLAENSVDAKSMRPSDVLIARNGMSVEIHNTDAEGRLVLADVLDVAVTQDKSHDPEIVIDVATLTGAIKAGLGADIPGLFSNDDSLAEALNKAGTAAGEPSWRMPLYSRYTRGMESAFADMVNASDGFGGAITAALFLEKFVKSKPWAHFDIYGWNDRPQGALTFAGGSGQLVQTLAEFLTTKSLKF